MSSQQLLLVDCGSARHGSGCVDGPSTCSNQHQLKDGTPGHSSVQVSSSHPTSGNQRWLARSHPTRLPCNSRSGFDLVRLGQLGQAQPGLVSTSMADVTPAA
eukprot:TRINITY_DN12604_c0_g1_i1.p2 TRINITY_DN12604_c0_g1~~TRINITY_DN12604_c0_g1_i1.p2  ORF type:complete len:102 (+),score=12.85 TRINITY_DN12604_c0_g1_i1:176-481(+)